MIEFIRDYGARNVLADVGYGVLLIAGGICFGLLLIGVFG